MKQEDFADLMASISEAGAIQRRDKEPSRQFHFEPTDIKQIRGRLGITQEEFALMIGVSVKTLRNWEQGRREPEGPARALLRIADREPEAVARALARA